MRRWLIKLSLTTSAKFVNCTVTSSLSAQILNLMVLSGLVWATVLSNIPLSLSIYLLLLVLQYHYRTGFVAKPSLGQWFVHRNGIVKCERLTSSLMKVDLSAKALKVTFVTECGRRVNVWRDGCDDRQYRQLCLILRQWQRGAEAPA
jgi:hypothetical protein